MQINKFVSGVSIFSFLSIGTFFFENGHVKGLVPLVKYGYINLTGKRIYMANEERG